MSLYIGINIMKEKTQPLLVTELYVLATANLDEDIKKELEAKDPEPQIAEAAIHEATARD
jgi:hypothetical protein